MKEFIQFLIKLLAETFGGIRDKERNAEAKEAIADARERADEKIGDMSVAGRDDILERLHRDRGGSSPSHSPTGHPVPDSEETTDPRYHG